MNKDISTRYFEHEGRAAMPYCLASAVECCARERIDKLVVFTGTGEGAHFVVKELLSRDEYRNLQLRIVAVTPPFGRLYKVNPTAADSPVIRAGIGTAMREELLALGVDVVAAHLPFKEIFDGQRPSSPWARVAEAYGVLGGGFALCIQAILVACDAGSIESGERVVVAAADTAFLAIASRTEDFLSPVTGLLVEHILCRPMRYSISKSRHARLDTMWKAKGPPEPLRLPPAPAQQDVALALPVESAALKEGAAKKRKSTARKRRSTRRAK